MVWLEYQISDGYVVKIHESEPFELDEGFAIWASDAFSINDEFTYHITVIRENGEVIGAASVRQAPLAQFLLKQLANKDSEIRELKQQLTITQEALDFIIMGGV